MQSKYRLIALALALAAAGAAGGAFANGDHASGDDEAAIGEPGTTPTRTVKVEMNDTMHYTPATMTVKKDETVRFVVTNSGKIQHEMVLGTPEMLKEHYEMMKKMPGMQHADANQVTVAPGGTGEIVWHFTKAGQVDFACLQPGHWEAGMKGAISVR